MTLVSYAQNFEDVMLHRALRGVSDGFWIDVGAGEPEELSVTCAFSRMGWRGINIEPQADAHGRLAAARPRDVNLRMAVGRVEGTIRLFVVGGGNGLTTTDRAVAERHATGGWSVEEQDVPVTTLAAIARQHVSGPVHFLKIDVEGAEADVLAGADFSSFRPWIILLEAVDPTSKAPVHQGWEPALLRAGYRFVYFDGLNRFYLADEKAGELGAAFAAPPNVMDDFILASHNHALAAATQAANRADDLLRDPAGSGREAGEIARSIASLAYLLAVADRRATASENKLAALTAERERLSQATREAAAQAQATISGLTAALAAADARLAQAAHRADAAAHERDAVLASTSWRLMAPVRGLMSLFRR